MELSPASARLAPVSDRAPPALSTPPVKLSAPLAADRVVSPPESSVASVRLMPADWLVSSRVVEAETCEATAIWPSAVIDSWPALAATPPSRRTPTPASVAIRRMRLAYMPPSALESMATVGVLASPLAAVKVRVE